MLNLSIFKIIIFFLLFCFSYFISYSLAILFNPTVDVKWRTDSNIIGNKISIDRFSDVVYKGSDEKGVTDTLEIFNYTTGDKIRSFKGNNESIRGFATPVSELFSEKVYVIQGKELFELNTNGKVLNTIDQETIITSLSVSTDIILGKKNGNLTRIDIESKSVTWNNKLTDDPIDKIKVTFNGLVVSSNNKIFILDKVTGNVIWSSNKKFNIIGTKPGFFVPILYLNEINTQKLSKYNSTGHLSWSKEYNLTPLNIIVSYVNNPYLSLISNNFESKLVQINDSNGNIIWEYNYSNERILDLKIAAEKEIVVSTTNGRIDAFNETNNSLKWTFNTTFEPIDIHPPRIPLNHFFVMDSNSNSKLQKNNKYNVENRIWRIKRENETLLPRQNWLFRNSKKIINEIEVGPKGDIYSYGKDNQLRKISYTGGNQIWKYNISTDINNNSLDSESQRNSDKLIIYRNFIFLTNDNDRIIYKLTLDAEQAWKRNLTINTEEGNENGFLYVGTKSNLYRISFETGKTIWKLNLESNISGDAESADNEGNIIVGFVNGEVSKFNSSGNLVWNKNIYARSCAARSYGANTKIKSLITDSNNNIYVSSDSGNIDKLDPSGKIIWSNNINKYRSNYYIWINSMIISHSSQLLFTADNSGFYYAFNTTNGNLLWFLIRSYLSAAIKSDSNDNLFILNKDRSLVKVNNTGHPQLSIIFDEEVTDLTLDSPLFYVSGGTDSESQRNSKSRQDSQSAGKIWSLQIEKELFPIWAIIVIVFASIFILFLILSSVSIFLGYLFANYFSKPMYIGGIPSVVEK